MAMVRLNLLGKGNIDDKKSVEVKVSILRSIIAIAIVSFFLMSALQLIISEAVLAETAQAEIRTFTIGMTEPVLSANPNVGENDADYVYYSYIYDELIVPDQDGIASPNLATSWWYMDGPNASSQPIPTDFLTLMGNNDPAVWPMGSIWEYNLTEDVFWSDGEPFTADDVVYSIKLQIGENYVNFWAYQPYSRWVFDIQEVDDYKVRVFFAEFDTHKPIPIAWGYSLNFGIYPKHALKDMTPLYIAQGWDGTPAIGLGPFTGTDNLRQEVIGGESITLVRNMFYNFTDPADGKQKGLGYIWKRPVEIDRLVMMFYADETPLTLDIRMGNIDACKLSPVNYLALKNLADRPKELNLVSTLSCTVYSYIVHWNVYKEAQGTLNPARLDSALWRAGALATNKTHIVDQMFKGLGMPGVGIITPVYPEWYWSPGDEPSTFNVTNGKNENASDYEILYTYTKPMKSVMDFDLDTANEILDAAGYVWNADHTVREIGPVAAQRLKNMSFIGDMNSALGLPLSFTDLIGQGVPLDKAISDYLVWEWEHIGIKLETSLVSTATWSTMVYGYNYDFTHTYWSGDVDPNYLLFIPTSYTIASWNEFGTEDPVYDHYYDMQAKTFNYTERKYWIDQCEKWQYLSGHTMYLCYPKTTFAYNEIRWTNWGNWTQHPCLAIDYFWGENPFIYHIKYISGGGGTIDLGTVTLIICVVAIAAIFAIHTRIRKKKEESMTGEEEDEDSGGKQEGT
jgi:peptide/nickel transport system substrate-binding protein